MRSLFVMCAVAAVAMPAAGAPAYRIVHSFSGNASGVFNGGADPESGLVEDASGNLYGTAASGGVKEGCGTVFQLRRTQTIPKPKFVFKKLHDFCQKKPVGGIYKAGQFPYAPLALGHDGALYGTTLAGGAHQAGTVFRLAQNGDKWDISVLHDFNPASGDGDYASAGLAVDAAGALYGTTYVGGSSADRGVVFKLTPGPSGWSYEILHTFTGGADGGNPRTNLILDSDGNLYGVATSGGDPYCRCGVIYKLSPGASGWTEEVLHTFSISNGYLFVSHGPLVRDGSGALYGVGEGNSDAGAVFKLASAGGQWNFNVLNTFSMSNNDGQKPLGGLIFDQAGSLYGTTDIGGVFGKGTVYKLTPNGNDWTRTTLHSFADAPKDGSFPVYVTLLRDLNGMIYGTTSWGGKSQYRGVVFELTP